MNSPNRFDFDPENLPVTPDGSFPLPNSPVVPGGPAAEDSPVAAAAAAAPSYPLDVQGEQPSPSREELEDLYSSGEGSSISRNLFPDDDDDDEEAAAAAADDDDDEEAAAAAAEVEMLEERFGKRTVDWYIEHYAAGWIDAIKRSHGYDSSKYGLVPIIVAPAPAGASGEKRKKPTKKKGKKRHRKGGGGKKKYKKKRTKKKSRKKKKKTLKKKRKRRKKKRKTRR